MSDDYIERQWRSYREQVMPPNASKVQIIECKRAFFAGALSLLSALIRDFDPNAEPTDNDMELISSVHRELEAFGSSAHFHHGTKGSA